MDYGIRTTRYSIFSFNMMPKFSYGFSIIFLQFNFRLVDDWTDEVSHLVMNQVTLTLKVMLIKTSFLFYHFLTSFSKIKKKIVHKYLKENYVTKQSAYKRKLKKTEILIQVANALAKGIPIVTPAFLSDFLVCQNTKQILPDPKQYIPPLSESTINANDVSLAVRKERQQVNN